jgi:hypothetical protein
VKARKTSQAVLEQKQILSKILPHISPPLDKDPKYFFRGDLRSSPLYANIGTQPDDRSNTPHHQRLQAQILIGIALVTHYQMEDNFDLMIAASLDALRYLTRAPEEYPSLPEPQLSPEDYLKALGAQNLNESLATIANFLACSLQLISRHSLKDLADILWANNKSTDGMSSIFQNLNIDVARDALPTLDENIEREDDEESESQTKPPAISFIFPKLSTPRLEADNYLRVVRAIANARAMENQLFHFHRDALNQFDIDTLLKFISTKHPQQQEGQLEVKIALGLMLVTGMKPERLANIRVVDSPTENTGLDFIIKPTNTLQVYSPGPKLKTTLPAKAINQATLHTNFIHLPLPQKLTELLSVFLSSAPSSPQKLFNKNYRQLNPACSQALHQLNRQHGTRLTTTMLSNHLQRELTHTPGSDISTASLILGKEIYLARTKIHYSCFSESHLQNIYQQTLNRMLREQVALTPHEAPNSLFMGTPRKPTLNSVKSLIENLTQAIKFGKKAGTRTREALIHSTFAPP